MPSFWFIIARFLAQLSLRPFEWYLTGVYPSNTFLAIRFWQCGRLRRVLWGADRFIEV